MKIFTEKLEDRGRFERLWARINSEYTESLGYEFKLLEFVAPLVALAQDGRLPLPYVIQSKGDANMTYSGAGLHQSGAAFGLPLHDYGSSSLRKIIGPFELRKTPEEQLHELERVGKPVLVAELVKYEESEFSVRSTSENGTDYFLTEDIARLLLLPNGMLKMGEVIERRKVKGRISRDYELTQNTQKGPGRNLVLMDMIELMKNAPKLSL